MEGGGAKKSAAKLAGASAVYGLGAVLSRGLAFVLLPVYTRVISPSDYGIVAVAATVASVLGVALPLGLHGAVTRFYFATEDDAERRKTNGTLWVASVVIAGAITLILDQFGGPLVDWLLPTIGFDPYIRLSVWTAFFTVLGLVPLAILQAQERAGAYVLLSTFASFATHACIVALVVWRDEGANGYLQGGLIGAIIAGIPYLLVAGPRVNFVVKLPTLRRALAYSLPLVPHALAGWVLELSDRAILSRFVPLSEVGVYSVGYQLGAAMGIVVTAFSIAWTPTLFKELARDEPTAERELSKLVSYFVGTFFFLGVGWALLSPNVMAWLLEPQYADAYPVTQIVVAAYALNALYLIPVGLLFWAKTTWMIPIVTIGGGLVNVALNLLLVPTMGAIAAAWSTLVGYGVMLVLAWLLARRTYSFPYEYVRLGKIVGLAVAVFAVSNVVAPSVGLASLFVRAIFWLSFPLGLFAFRIFDLEGLREFLNSLRRRSN